MKNSIAAIQQTRNLLLISILIISNIAHAQWTQMGPGAGGQERAVYLRDKGLGSFDFYVGSDVSGVWRTTGLNTNNWANPASYNYDFISDHEPMRFINEFYAPNQYTSDFLFVTNRSGIHKLNAATNALPMQKLWGTGQPFVNDIFISAEHTAGVHTLYFVTGNERVDNRMNHKDDNTNDFYWGTLDATTETTISNINSIKLNNLLIRPHVYCMHVDEKNLTDQTDDEFMLGTDSGLYKFTLQQAIDAVANSGGVLPSSTQIGWPYLSGVIDSYDTIDKGNLLAVTDIMRYNSLQAPNDFMITIYGLGVFYWDNSTGTWQWQMNKLEGRQQGNNSTIIFYDGNLINNLDHANNFTRILPVNYAGTTTRQGYLLFNEEPLKEITNGKAYIGIFYSPVISNLDIRPKGDWVALSASTNMINNDYGWNTTRPCSNRNGMLLLPDNRLIVGASGNIFVTKDPITNNTGTVKWQQVYTSTVASSILDLPEYQHRGYVNTANKTIYPATDNEIWIGQADRLVFKSDDGVNGFYDIENPATPYTITYTGTNSNIPTTDCWFITNNKVDAADQNVYIGIGEGFATNVGNGHVMQVNKNQTNIFQLGDQILGGDPVKIMFTKNGLSSQKYLLSNDLITLNHRKRIRCLQGSVWTPNTLNTVPPLANNYEVRDFVVSKDGTKLFAIIESGNVTKFYRFTNINATTWAEECSDVVINITDLSPRILKLYYYDNGTKFKVLCGTAPNSVNLATSNMYEVYDSNINNPCSTITAINNMGAILFFQNLNYDEGDATDGGITAIEINEHLNVIYVAAMRFDPPAIVSSHIYRATYDPATGTINQNSWADVSTGMHNKAVIALSTNGRSVCNESVYACLRGLGGWKLDLPQGTVNQITQADFSSSTSITKSGLLSGPVVCGTSIVTIDGANIGITDPTVTITVVAGQTLNIINGASLFACSDMWQGIINNGGTVNITNSTVEDAIIAMDTKNSGQFTLSNSTFDHNYITLKIQNGDYVNMLTGKITGCTFKCTGNKILKAPHVNELSLYHIHLIDVENFTIGDAGNTNLQNTFEPAKFGIYALTEKLKVYNNKFKGSNSNTPGINQVGIYTNTNFEHDVLQSLNGIVIGGTGLQINTFDDYYNGILMYNTGEPVVKQNVFTKCINGATAVSSGFGLPLSGGYANFNSNTFDNCGNGIYCRESQGTPKIVLNKFNINQQYNIDDYGLEAIRVENFMQDAFPIVKENTINNMAIGIHLRNVIEAQVRFNHYTTHITNADIAVLNFPNIGVWIDNCTNSTIIENTIERLGTDVSDDAQQDLMQGINMDISTNCVLHLNNTTNMGTDINVIADCNPATISCNNMTSSNRGINFNNASIVTGNNYYDNSTASDNTWNGDYLLNNNERISGGFNGGFALDWHHQGDDIQGNMFAPHNHSLAINPTPFALSNGCPESSPDNTTLKSAQNAALNLAQYDEFVSQNRYADDASAFSILLNDSNMRDSLTNLYGYIDNWYNYLSTANIGKFEEIQKLLAANNRQAAINKANTLITSSVIYQNLKTLSLLFANNLISTDSIPTDSSVVYVLNTIADQDPTIGGKAVWIARAILRKDIFAFSNNLNRVKNEIKVNSAIETADVSIKPNPANKEITVSSNSIIKEIVIEDMQGMRVKQLQLTENANSIEINISNLTSGVYVVKCHFENEKYLFTKLVITK